MKFTVHSQSSAPEASRPTLAMAEKTFGFVPNLFGVLAESPAAIEAYASINNALNKCSLTPIEQQVATLTISARSGCHYCMAAHSTIAQMVKMPENILAELRNQQSLLDPKLEALRVFTLSALQYQGMIPEKELNAFMSSGYDRQHVLDVITIIALKTLSNYTNHIANTPVDEPFTNQKWAVTA